MPAVTADTLTLPRVTPLPEQTGRPVLSVTTAPKSFEGEGFPVNRAFAGVPMDLLDPFLHMDQMGEVEYGVGEPDPGPGLAAGHHADDPGGLPATPARPGATVGAGQPPARDPSQIGRAHV